MNVSDLLGQNMLEYVSRLIFNSESFTVPHDGWAIVTGMGGGAGGNKSYSPGNSAGWGVRTQAVNAGDVIAFAIGAGGAIVYAENTPAAAGGNTVISLNGTPLMTCQGGDAGPRSAETVAPVVATIVGADYWRAGSPPRQKQNQYYSGGAAVDMGFGTSGTDSAGSDTAPKGFLMWPFNLVVAAHGYGELGNGGSSYGVAGIFGGGGGTALGQSSSYPPGRGGSAGRSNYTNPHMGGAGMGYLRLYKRIGG